MAEKTAEDIEFEKKLAKATYKTTYQDLGTNSSKCTHSHNISDSPERPWDKREVHRRI